MADFFHSSKESSLVAFSQGIYKVVNREKYLGTTSSTTNNNRTFTHSMNDPVYRSSWEQRLMAMLDNNANIIRWGFENIIIPYMNFDGKQHRYIMDFYCEIFQGKDKPIKKLLIEVKPLQQTQPPKKPKINNRKAMNRFMYESKTYVTNQNKWKATKQFCKKNNMEFKIMTEKDLFK